MRKRTVLFISFAFLLVLVAAAFMTACDGNTREIVFLIDGEVYFEATVKDGSVVAIPKIERTEYLTFKGWFLDGELYREDSVTVDRDMTFEAVWHRDYYDIYYVVYDGWNSALNPSRFATGSEVDLYEPTRPGYTFVGWYIDGERIEKLTDDVFNGSDAGSITLFSEWTPIECTVNFDAQGGDLSCEGMTVAYGERLDFPVPERYGYTFEGWFNGYDRVTDGKGMCLSSWSYTGVVELTAKWKINPSDTGLTILPSDSGYVLDWASDTSATLIVPDYVTEIGENAFESNTTCTELLFAEGSRLTVVGDRAFYKSKIRNIVLPAGVVSIGDKAFGSCPDLESVAFEDGSKLDHIGDRAFANCRSLRSVELPATIREIPSRAFIGCYSLYRFVVPEGCRYIFESAFENCYALASLTLSSDVEYIGNNAFSGCRQLREIYNLSALPLVAGDTAYGLVAKAATDIYTDADAVSKVVVTSDGFVFYDAEDGAVLVTALNGKGKLTLPSSYEGTGYVIGSGAFYYRGYTGVVIPDAVTEIGEMAFGYCASLESVTIGAGTTEIGENAFMFCSALKEVRLPEDSQLTKIGAGAFRMCSSLPSFTVTANVSDIGLFAFEKCENLLEVFNFSALDIVAGSEDHGGVALYAVNVYTSLD